ncbi:MAG: hypothetical protein K8U57_10770 [Planctomycetes bacterium]|nr:hypothetical protein [Planctomycetota bacterium]
MPRLWLVFDVESVGLHGEGFAVAWVVIDSDGRELEARRESCPIAEAAGSDSGRAWVRDNCPALPITCATPIEVRQEFWLAWTRWKAEGAMLVAECGWPVEARFLAACVDDVRPAVRSGKTLADSPRDFGGPFPLHEVASFRVGAGQNSWNKPQRLPTELPEHDPLADARLSARLLVGALRNRTVT